ncbi:hypothetical protein Trydic_g2686 [Trypoxylus dichotomus]
MKVDVEKFLPLGILKEKSHRDLNRVTVQATSRLLLNRLNGQETFPSPLCASCDPVLLKSHLFYIQIVQFGTQKVSNISTVPINISSYRYITNHSKIGNCTPNIYDRGMELPFLDFARITSSPAVETMLVYASTEVEVGFIATQNNSISGNLFKNFCIYGSTIGIVSFT